MSVKYGKTPIGQLLFDLAFANLSDKWLARKHKIPIAHIRDLRNMKQIKSLAREVAANRKRDV